MDFLRIRITQAFPQDCRVLGAVGRPDYAFNAERKQYFSTQILKEMSHVTPEDAKKVIGVVDVDLYVPILTFVFGEAQLNGRAAIVSLFRLHQEHYGMAPNNDLLKVRAVKEVVHELGHTFGLTHCSHYKCVMHFSHSLRNIDMKSADFCGGCTDLLSALSSS